MTRTEGHDSFAAWVAEQGTMTGVARRLDVNGSTISRLCAGIAEPSIALALRIEAETSGRVPVGSWVRRSTTRRARRAA